VRRYETIGECWVMVERNGIMLHRRVWGAANAGKEGIKMVLVTDGVYCRCTKSGKQPGEGHTMEATKEEAKAGARRWRQHKEGGESGDETSDGVRDLGAEMDGARSASEDEGESESGDSSGASPGSVAEADETYVEEERSGTERRAPRRRRNTDNRVVSGDESESERSGGKEEPRGKNREQWKMAKKQRRAMRAATWMSKSRTRGGA
jgi:hypothetical protein